MDLAEGKLKDIEAKLRLLVENHQKLKNEKDLLTGQSVIRERIIEDQKIETENLKKQVRALEDTRHVDTRQKTAGVKDRIQDLVREIDRCIELLNK